MTDFYIDPQTGDHVLADGLIEMDEEITTQIYLCLMTERGTRLGDAEFGSRLHELAQEKSPAAAALRVDGVVLEALQPLFDEGALDSVTTSSEVMADGLAISITVEGPGLPPTTFRVTQELES